MTTLEKISWAEYELQMMRSRNATPEEMLQKGLELDWYILLLSYGIK